MTAERFGKHRSIAFSLLQKIQLIECAGSDDRLTPFDVRVLVIVLSAVDSSKGFAIRSQTWLATKVGGSERGVRQSTSKLQGCGYLEIRRPDDRAAPAHAGAGMANVYFPGSPETDETPEPRHGHAGNPGTPVPRSDDAPRQMTTVTPANSDRHPGMGMPPFLLDSNILPGRAAPTKSLHRGDADWNAIKGRLAQRFTDKVVDAWFGKFVCLNSDADNLVMIAPSKFILNYVNKTFDVALEQAAAAVRPDGPPLKVRFVEPAATQSGRLAAE